MIDNPIVCVAFSFHMLLCFVGLDNSGVMLIVAFVYLLKAWHH